MGDVVSISSELGEVSKAVNAQTPKADFQKEQDETIIACFVDVYEKVGRKRFKAICDRVLEPTHSVSA